MHCHMKVDFSPLAFIPVEPVEMVKVIRMEVGLGL